MASKIEGTYDIKSWDEKTWDGKDHKAVKGAKLTHAVVKHGFFGGIEGEGTVQYEMAYRDEANVTFVGLLQITGQIGDQKGSFVAKIEGGYENGAASSTWTIIPGSGTGDLKGITGKGSTVAVHADTQPFTLEYTL